MNWRTIAGISACLLLVSSTFMHWAWYPDIQEHFTGWYSRQNHYGKPGKIITVLASVVIVLFVVDKPWSKRVILFVAGINMGYAIKSFILFTSSYSGFVPTARTGIYIMLLSSIALMLSSVAVFGVKKIQPSGST